VKPVFQADLLEGKKILVTGASSGIGRAAALALSSVGAQLVISGRNAERLAQTAAALPGACSIEPFEFLGFESSAAWIGNMVQQHGPFDGLFHAAGEALLKPMRLVKEKDVHQMLNPSLVAAAALCAGLSKKGGMRDGAAIVLMSSVAGSVGRQGMGLYSASKAAIDGLSRSLAVELAPRGIRVNSIAAGAVRTEMHRQIEAESSEQAMADYAALHPLGFGDMADVTNMVVYLLSAAGAWITGTVLTVDGGYTAR